MGKGDQRSKRGKIHRGTFGRRRPKSKTKKNNSEPVLQTSEAPVTKQKTKEAKVVKKQPAE